MTYAPGNHALLDLYGCDAALLADAAALQALLQRAADAAGATTLAAHFHHFGDGMGVTGVLLLAESHLSIHTWSMVLPRWMCFCVATGNWNAPASFSAMACARSASTGGNFRVESVCKDNFLRYSILRK